MFLFLSSLNHLFGSRDAFVPHNYFFFHLKEMLSLFLVPSLIYFFISIQIVDTGLKSFLLG